MTPGKQSSAFHQHTEAVGEMSVSETGLAACLRQFAPVPNSQSAVLTE